MRTACSATSDVLTAEIVFTVCHAVIGANLEKNLNHLFLMDKSQKQYFRMYLEM